MARRKNQHVVPRGDEWAVIGAGNSRATATFETQEDAIAAAREIASNQKSELVIHGRDGRIRGKNTYGKDPVLPRG